MFENKYRAWDIENNIMLFFEDMEALMFSDGQYCDLPWTGHGKDRHVNAKIMQYTGDRDRFKKDLFVGDVARFYPLEDEPLFFYGIAKVVDTQTGWTWEIIEKGNIEIDSTSFWNDDFEIIGNIFEGGNENRKE